MAEVTNDPPPPDFSNDDEFNAWFQRNAWTGRPSQWDLPTVRRIKAESFIMRRELDRRMAAASDGKIDRALFWSGFGISAAGVALLFFPPVAIPALLTTSLTFSGMGATLFSKARTQMTIDALAQIGERSRDLNNLQPALSAREQELSR